MMVIVDNYDSFTYNLVQYFEGLGTPVTVYRNDAITVDEIEVLDPCGIVISPGPGRPEDAGISMDVVKRFSGKIPILGVCLGHQVIAAAYGGAIVGAAHLMHGKTSKVDADGKTLYSDVRNPFKAMRYHSLAVSAKDLPACLEISAMADDGEIMGIRHKTHLTEGIQFHPESIMTPAGKRLLRNFINLKKPNPAH